MNVFRTLVRSLALLAALALPTAAFAGSAQVQVTGDLFATNAKGAIDTTLDAQLNDADLTFYDGQGYVVATFDVGQVDVVDGEVSLAFVTDDQLWGNVVNSAWDAELVDQAFASSWAVAWASNGSGKVDLDDAFGRDVGVLEPMPWGD